MKLLLDIQDNKAAFLMELLGDLSFVKTTALSAKDISLLGELKQIQEAYQLADKVKSGQLKGTPARDFLNEL